MAARFSTLLAALPEGVLLGVDGDTDVTAPVVEANDQVLPGGVFVARQGLQ